MMIVASLLAACSSPKPLYQQEQFDAASSPYARTFHQKAAATCEAARRALLSQGYMTSSMRPDAVDGSKNFQPNNDSHVVIEFHVVCADADADGASSVAYVNAVQDRYALKKSNTSASVGLSVFGSLSLPIGSSDDAMVKIASETIPAGVFYERFFNLVDHFLKIDSRLRGRAAAKAAEKEPVAPLPEPAATPADAPLKMNTPVVPAPSAMPLRARLAGTSVAATAAAATEATQTPAPASASTVASGTVAVPASNADANPARVPAPTSMPAPVSAQALVSPATPNAAPALASAPASASSPASASASAPASQASASTSATGSTPATAGPPSL
jgi:hypothetical protein